jgi:VanZ family protein
MALIFSISSFKVDVPGVRSFPWQDKGIHFVEYGILGWLCAAASIRTWPTAPAWRTAAYAVFVTVVWGLYDEIHQAMVPGRFPELADVVADSFGAVAGAALCHIFSNRTVS